MERFLKIAGLILLEYVLLKHDCKFSIAIEKTVCLNSNISMLEKLLSFLLTLQFFLNHHFNNLTGSLLSLSKERCFYLYKYLDMH